MRMLMSFDTSTTSRFGFCSTSALTTPRIWLSALPCGRPCGRLTGIRWAWKKGLPADSGGPGPLGRIPAARVGVGLLERDHRQVDVVLVEAEQRRRVVHQHVGVEDEQGRRPVATGLS